jgi:DNA-directed RNA polymerase subunit RPC12/RpoP
MCAACRKRFGLTRDAMPEVGAPEPCARCGHTEIVQALLRQPKGDGEAVAIGVTYAVRARSAAVDSTLGVVGERPLGLMVAHVCRRCGKTEIFTVNPQQIPIGTEYGTRLVKLSPKTPYRG